MDFEKTQEQDLTDAKIWKPIVAEINKILEQREILRSTIGVK